MGGHRAAAAAVSGDDANLRLASQPRFRARRLPVRHKGNRLAAFAIAQKRSMVLFPGPIVDADYRRRRELRGAATAYGAKQGVIARPDIEPPRQCRRRPAAEREAMNDFIKTGRAPGVASDGAVKPFGEHSAFAGIAEKLPRSQDHLRSSAYDRQVEQSARSGCERGEQGAARRARTRRRPDLIATMTRSASIATFSTMRPGGTSSEARSARMALIVLLTQAKSTAQFHQMRVRAGSQWKPRVKSRWRSTRC